jgi:hypothetical protein
MAKQYEVLDCPFCHKGQISCLYFPSAVSNKRNVTASLPGRGSVQKSKEVWIMQSGCSNCGKGKDEVERELRKEGFL